MTRQRCTGSDLSPGLPASSGSIFKTETGRVTPEQETWIEGLRASGVEAYVVNVPGAFNWLDDLLSPDPEQLTLTGSTGFTTWTPQRVR